METRKNRNGRSIRAVIILIPSVVICIFSCSKPKIAPRNVEITFTHLGTNEGQDSINWTSDNKILHEFELSGDNSIRCALTVIANESVVFSQYINEHWQTIDTLGYSIFSDVTPVFKITDFNQDGNEDFMFRSHTNVNGNDWEKIFLNNPSTGQLQKLHTTPDEEDVWSAPEYNPKTKTISCTLVSGNYGLSADYTYRLDGFTAIPLKKVEQDNTQLNAITGEGAQKRIYIGKNSKWVLK